MNITQRRLYMLSFVITFFLTAPVLVFLAKGYAFDRIGKVFVHNGAITIKSTPKKVDIYLDGKKISKKRLNIINNYYVVNGVRFGSHIIECRKDGYTTWKKKVDVHSGISTEFWNVLLFPIENKTLHTFSPNGIKRFFLSPRQDDELVLYKEVDDKKIISLFTANNEQEDFVYETTIYNKLFPEADENIEWSSNHKKLLVPAMTSEVSMSATTDQKIRAKKTLENNTTIDKFANKNMSQKDYIILDLKNRAQTPIDLLEILSQIDLSNLQPIHNLNSEKTKANNSEDRKLVNGTTEDRQGKILNKQLSVNKEGLTDQFVDSKKDSNLNIPDDKVLNSLEIYQARWMFNSDYQILVLTKNHQLLFINIENPSQSSLLAENVTGFDLAGDHIYYIDLTSQKIIDIKPDKPAYKQIVSKINIEDDTSSFVKLFAYDELRMATVTSNGELYILNKLLPKDTASLISVEQSVLGVQFSDDGKKLLYWTNANFWTYMLRKWDKQPKRDKDEKVFITNFNSGIKNVQWMEDYENIIFTNNNIIKSAELDNRDRINLSNIFQLKTPAVNKNYLYNKDTSTLYFLDKTKDIKTGSFKLQSIKALEKTKLFEFGN